MNAVRQTKRKAYEEFNGEKRTRGQNRDLCRYWLSRNGCHTKKCSFLHPQEYLRSGDYSSGQKWNVSNGTKKQYRYNQIPNGKDTTWKQNSRENKNKTVLFRNTPEIYKQNRAPENFSLPSSKRDEKTKYGKNDKNYQQDEWQSNGQLKEKTETETETKTKATKSSKPKSSKSKRYKMTADKFFCSFLNNDAKENISSCFCKEKAPCKLSNCELAHDEQHCLDIIQPELKTLKLPLWKDLKIQYCATPSCGREEEMTLGSLSHNKYRNYEKVSIGLQCRVCVKYQEKCYFQKLKQNTFDSYLMLFLLTLFGQAKSYFSFLFLFDLSWLRNSLFFRTKKEGKRKKKKNKNKNKSKNKKTRANIKKLIFKYCCSKIPFDMRSSFICSIEGNNPKGKK